MAGTAGERLHGLVNEQTVDAVLVAIDQALTVRDHPCPLRGQAAAWPVDTDRCPVADA